MGVSLSCKPHEGRERGKKEVQDEYICTLKEEDWVFGAQVLSWLDDLFFQSLHARIGL